MQEAFPKVNDSSRFGRNEFGMARRARYRREAWGSAAPLLQKLGGILAKHFFCDWQDSRPYATQKACQAHTTRTCKRASESWESLLDHVKTVSDSIQIANGVLATLRSPSGRRRWQRHWILLCLLLMSLTTSCGRACHSVRGTHISGRCVAKSEETGTPINKLSVEQMKAIDERFDEDITDTSNYETSVEAKSAKGGWHSPVECAGADQGSQGYAGLEASTVKGI